MKRLVLIDGHSILYRAYHALPPLTSTDGKPSNALYGFVSMLLKTINELHPDYLAIVFDRPGGTFRNELYDQYQAHRKEPDDDFIVQIPRTQELLSDMGFTVLGADGYEADDVIGTLATQVSNNHATIETLIVTSDRDQLQLVTDQVQLVMPANGLGKTKQYGEQETIERMGVAPKHVADFKGLAGDPSDNIPGVSGIGPKTAADLINQFGSVEAVYDHLDDIDKKSVHTKLAAGKDMALLSKKLATIVCDVPLKYEVEQFQVPDLVRPEVVELVNKLGFKSLVKRLSQSSATEQKQPKPATDKKQKQQKKDEQLGLF